MRYSLKSLFVVCGLMCVSAFVVAYLLNSFVLSVWHGHISVTVAIVDSSFEKSKGAALSYRVCYSHQEALATLRDLNEDDRNNTSPRYFFTPAKFVKQDQAVLSIPCSGSSSVITGREHTYTQPSHVVLRVKLPRNKAEYRIVKLPDKAKLRQAPVIHLGSLVVSRPVNGL